MLAPPGVGGRKPQGWGVCLRPRVCGGEAAGLRVPEGQLHVAGLALQDGGPAQKVKNPDSPGIPAPHAHLRRQQ